MMVSRADAGDTALGSKASVAHMCIQGRAALCASVTSGDMVPMGTLNYVVQTEENLEGGFHVARGGCLRSGVSVLLPRCLALTFNVPYKRLTSDYSFLCVNQGLHVIVKFNRSLTPVSNLFLKSNLKVF